MVYSSPFKRTALGSISSILNTTPKTPAKQGRVGKSATPRTSGIRQKFANLFSANKENSPRKTILGDWKRSENGKVQRREESVYDLLAMDEDQVSSEKVDEVQKSGIASVVDVFLSSNVMDQQVTSPPPSPPPRISPEIRKIATLLSSRLRLAAYKVSTQQIHTPFSELAVLPMDSSDSVSRAIQRFRESKRIQDQAEYYRKHRLATICRRESRRTRHQKLQPTIIAPIAQRPRMTRQPSTITEVPSDQEPGLPSPPDSEPSKTPSNETPSTPAPKPKARKFKKRKVYNEYNGHLGLSSPPQEAYDLAQDEWYMDEVEVGDVPSSVLRGVEGLWALGC